MSKSISWAIYFSFTLLLLTACGISQDATKQEVIDSIAELEGDKATSDVESMSEDGIFKEQKTFSINNISFTRHHIFIKQGQIEEHIYYTFFEDQSRFGKLNEIITEFVNATRFDSIKIAEKSPLEDEVVNYESTQRMDTVYFINQDLITVELNYQYIANGMECEIKENKLISYAISKKDVISLKDIFGARTSEAQKIIGEKLQAEFLKEIDNYVENAYIKPSEGYVNTCKQKFATINFLKDTYLGILKDALVFSYAIGYDCNLPPFLIGKVAIKDLAHLLPAEGSKYLKD